MAQWVNNLSTAPQVATGARVLSLNIHMLQVWPLKKKKKKHKYEVALLSLIATLPKIS